MNGWENFTNCENFKRFHRGNLKVKSKVRYIITGERLPSLSLSFITKIILLIFTTANDSPNLAHRLLMAFCVLEKRKHKNFLEKHNVGAHVNIEQKPMEPP